LLRSPDEVHAFDEALVSVAAVMDPRDLPDLLAVFTDDADYFEAMWGLVHLVEDFEVRAEVEALVDALPRMAIAGPEWARLLHQRIANNPPAAEVYRDAIARDPRRATIARRWLAALIAEDPDFAEVVLVLGS
jgi:hypothetical protein